MQPTLLERSNFDTQSYDSEVIFVSTHTNTHIHAPSHLAQAIDKILINRFVCSNNEELFLMKL